MFDVARNLQIARIDVSGETTALAFAPDDSMLAVGLETGAIDVWSGDGARRLRMLPGHGGIEALAFAPDGRSLRTIGEDGSESRWMLARGASLEPIRHPLRRDETLEAAAFSPNGEWLVEFAGDLSQWPDGARVQVWNGRSRSSAREMSAPEQPPMAIAVSADGRWVAAGTNYSILYVWDTTSGAAALRARRPSTVDARTSSTRRSLVSRCAFRRRVRKVGPCFIAAAVDSGV